MGFRLDYSLDHPGFDSNLTKTLLLALWCLWSRVSIFSCQPNYQCLPASYLYVSPTQLLEETFFSSLLSWMASPATQATWFVRIGGHLGPPGRQYFGGQGLLHLQISEGLGVHRSKRWESHHSSLGASRRSPLAAFYSLCASLAVSHLSFSANSLGLSNMFYISHCVLVVTNNERQAKLLRE